MQEADENETKQGPDENETRMPRANQDKTRAEIRQDKTKTNKTKAGTRRPRNKTRQDEVEGRPMQHKDPPAKAIKVLKGKGGDASQLTVYRRCQVIQELF